MVVIIVEDAHGAIRPLADQLTVEGFKVQVVGNPSAVVSFIKKTSIQFLVAEDSILIDSNLGPEVLKHCPLARLIAVSTKPNDLKILGALSDTLIDHFPLQSKNFPEIVKVMIQERDRLERWQQFFLTGYDPS